MTQEPDIKRWTAKRKAELIKQIYRGQTTVPEAARHYDLTQQEIEKWMDDAEAGMDNVIFKSWVADKIRFDETFAQTGGADTLFFRRAVELGAKIKFCSTAAATEEVPETRRQFKWRLQRQFRYGLMHCKIERKLSDGASPVFLICRALLILPLGVLEAVVKLLFRGVEGAKEGLDRSMRGLGSLCYFLGIRYSEYKRK